VGNSDAPSLKARGDGPPALLIHGTGTDSGFLDRVASRLAAGHQLLTYDREGWGETEPAEDFRRTSIAEQAIQVAGLLRSRRAADDRDSISGEPGPGGSVTVLGVGFGAVVALELALAEPDLVDRAILVEPPLLGLLPSATAGVSTDVEVVRATVEAGGSEAAYEIFLSGGLPTLGAGAERLGDLADRGPVAAHTFLVELPAVSAWPIDPVRLGKMTTPVVVATCPDSPGLLTEVADALAPRIPRAERAVAGTGTVEEAVIELLGG
jgi:pimeloyl-ACP methyl ester carboxylesterase